MDKLPAASESSGASNGSMKRKVLLFTQPDCPPCFVVKAFLDGMGVDYEERDVTQDQTAVEELLQKYGSNSTPTVVVGEQVLVGFNPERLDKIFGE
jgi:glutaredoxin-like YruB-family protein